MTPRTELYVHSLRVLDVPARPSPSAMRSLTGSAIDVLTTASTWTGLSIKQSHWRGVTYNAKHIFDANKYDHNGEDLPVRDTINPRNVVRRNDDLPGNHGHAEANKSAYTQTCEGTDHDLYDAGKSETDTRMYGVHASHRSPEIDDE